MFYKDKIYLAKLKFFVSPPFVLLPSTMIGVLHVVCFSIQLFQLFVLRTMRCKPLAVSNLQPHGVDSSKHAKGSDHQPHADEQGQTAKTYSDLYSTSIAMQADA